MLNQNQILLCGMMTFRVAQCEETLAQTFPGQVQRQQEALRALHLYDAYLRIIDATFADAYDPSVMVAFNGFLAAEVQMAKQDRVATVWSVADLLGSWA